MNGEDVNKKSVFDYLKKFKIVFYVLATIIFSGLVDLLFTEIGLLYTDYYLSLGISFIIIIFIAFIIDLIIFLKKYPRKTTLEECVNIINKTGEKFIIPSKTTSINMFAIDDVEKSLAINNQLLNKPKRNIIYYSLSVKKYLNWIDFTFFKFLGELQKELKCNIIIGLHYNDKMRETMSISHHNQIYYKELRNWFKNIIKDIVGVDTLISYEDNIYKVKHRKYANNFHSFYNSQVIKYATDLYKNDGVDCNNKYKSFKRKLSNLESAFPIGQLAKKYSKNKRFIVLDNIKCLLDWQDKESYLYNLRCENPFIILAASTLVDANGIKIDVHDENLVPNLTDNVDVLKRKIKCTNIEVKKLMYSLLKPVDEAKTLKDEKSYNLALEEIYNTIVKKYNIRSFNDSGVKLWEE